MLHVGGARAHLHSMSWMILPLLHCTNAPCIRFLWICFFLFSFFLQLCFSFVLTLLLFSVIIVYYKLVIAVAAATHWIQLKTWEELVQSEPFFFSFILIIANVLMACRGRMNKKRKSKQRANKQTHARTKEFNHDRFFFSYFFPIFPYNFFFFVCFNF